MRTIYHANVRTAHAAGQWERIQRTKRVLPYLIYIRSTAERPRPEHLAWAGTVLPVDDPWWRTHYPPNGWNCQCRVRQVSRIEAERLGVKRDEAPPRPADFGVAERRHRVTGEIERTPVGVDPGWAQNPGATRVDNVQAHLTAKLDALTPEARRIAIGDVVGSPFFRQVAEGEIPHVLRGNPGHLDPANLARGHIAFPVASIDEPLARALGAETRTVILSVADATKQLGKEGEPRATFRAEDYALAQAILDAGEAFKDGDDVIVQAEIKGEWWRLILRRAARVATQVYLKSLHRSRPEQAASARRRLSDFMVR